MRFSRRRKLAADVTKITVTITVDAHEMLDRIAGQDSLAATVEELIIREYRRREKRLSMALENSCCPDLSAMQNSPREKSPV